MHKCPAAYQLPASRRYLHVIPGFSIINPPKDWKTVGWKTIFGCGPGPLEMSHFQLKLGAVGILQVEHKQQQVIEQGDEMGSSPTDQQKTEIDQQNASKCRTESFMNHCGHGRWPDKKWWCQIPCRLMVSTHLKQFIHKQTKNRFWSSHKAERYTADLWTQFKNAVDTIWLYVQSLKWLLCWHESSHVFWHQS